MKYMAMIFAPGETVSHAGTGDGDMAEAHARFAREARDTGVLAGGAVLHSSDMATVVRAMDSGTTVSDGSFTAPGHALCGFYMFECENLDQAIEWAARIPGARSGAVEVRPVLQGDSQCKGAGG
jgi:hypothetical protein